MDDIITNYGEKSVINGESGNDLIKNNIFDYETLNSDNFSIEVSDNSNLYTRSNAALLGGNYSTIFGGNGRDSIKNSGNNVSISVGKGNDKLWGGENADIFFYSRGDGRDIIYGFDNADILQITGSFSTSYSENKGEIAFKVGSTRNAIKLKDFTATSFNINGETYKISGNTLSK